MTVNSNHLWGSSYSAAMIKPQLPGIIYRLYPSEYFWLPKNGNKVQQNQQLQICSCIERTALYYDFTKKNVLVQQNIAGNAFALVEQNLQE